MKNTKYFAVITALAITGLFINGFKAQAEDSLLNITTTADTGTALQVSNDAEGKIVLPRTGAALETGVNALIADTLTKSITPSDGDAFCSELVKSFQSQNADVNASFAWQSTSYSKNLELYAKVSDDQKALFEKTKTTISDTNELLAKVNAGGNDAIFRVIARSALISLSGEFKKEGGPDAARVNNLNQIISGAIGCMKASSNSSDESNLQKVKDSVVSLSNSWDEKKGSFGDTSVKSETTVEETAVPYTEKAKLFGFIPTHLTSKVMVQTDGSITIKRPWYRFLFSQKAHKGIDEVQKVIDDSKIDLKTSANAEARAKALETLQNKLKMDATAETTATSTVN